MWSHTGYHGSVPLYHRREAHLKLGFGVARSLHDVLGLLTPGHKVLVLVHFGYNIVHFLHWKPLTEMIQVWKIDQQTLKSLRSQCEFTQLSDARSTPSFYWWDWWNSCFGKQSPLYPSHGGKALWDFWSSECHMMINVWQGTPKQASC